MMSLQQRAELDSMRRAQPLPMLQPTVEQQRAAYAALMSHMIVPDGIRTTPADLGGMRTLLVEPDGPSRPGTILFFHGGSFVVGSPETELGLTASLVVRTGFPAYSPDYRLAPEHPFPAGGNDGLAAHQALLGPGVGAPLIRAKRAGLPMPAAAVLFSPGLDATRTGASMDTKAGIDPILTREGLQPNLERYLAGADPHQELLSPATLADLTGFPPLLLQVGTNEILLDDSTRLAERARDAGVDVILDVTAGVPHVFQTYAGTLDEADQALDRAALFLTQHLSPAPA